MISQVTLKPWGNSQGICIPKSILKELNLHISDPLQLQVENDAIVIKKAFQHKSFEERLAEFGGEISVYDFDWGDPVGEELL